jgi:hypothetical protein
MKKTNYPFIALVLTTSLPLLKALQHRHQQHLQDLLYYKYDLV